MSRNPEKEISDLNLLFAGEGLHLKILNKDLINQGLSKWMQDKSKSLGDILQSKEL